MENKKYELDKVLIDINSNSDNKDNSMSTYLCNYAKILEAFINDINDLKNGNGAMLEEFDIIDKFKKLVISEADRCIILNRSNSPISDNKNNKENTVSDNTLDLNELINKYCKYIDPCDFLYPFTKKDNTVSDNTLDLNELINKFTADGKNYNKDIDINKEDNNVTKQKVNEPIKPKTIKPKEDYNKEEDPLDDFEFVAGAFSRLISKFNKGDI